jgi:hypothetical protein
MKNDDVDSFAGEILEGAKTCGVFQRKNRSAPLPSVRLPELRDLLAKYDLQFSLPWIPPIPRPVADQNDNTPRDKSDEMCR